MRGIKALKSSLCWIERFYLLLLNFFLVNLIIYISYISSYIYRQVAKILTKFSFTPHPTNFSLTSIWHYNSSLDIIKKEQQWGQRNRKGMKAITSHAADSTFILGTTCGPLNSASIGTGICPEHHQAWPTWTPVPPPKKRSNNGMLWCWTTLKTILFHNFFLKNHFSAPEFNPAPTPHIHTAFSHHFSFISFEIWQLLYLYFFLHLHGHDLLR